MKPQQAVERALELSRADECVVIAQETSDANLRWAGNTLTTNGAATSRDLTVIAVIGGAAGVVSRSGPGAADVEDLVRASEQAARDSTPSEDARPLAGPERAPEPAGPAGSTAAAGKAWDDPPSATTIEVFENLAPALGEAFERAAGSGRKLFGFANHEVASTFVGTSTGLRLRHDQPSGTIEVNAKSADLERSAWAGVGTRDFGDVDVTAIDAGLAQRLEWARRSVELPAGRYETLLPPAAVADLMLFMYGAAGARDAQEGRTVFSRAGGGTRVGEKLTDLPVTLRSDPDATGLECAPFMVAHASGRESSVFDNGLALGATDWLRDGTLTSLVQTRHSAQLTGLPVTPMIGNLLLESPGERATLPDMIARTERGLLLTCLWYIRPVDPQTLLLTGLTRDGVYLVENGEVVGAVNNFRFNESPVSLLGRATEVGASGPALSREMGDNFPRTAMPPLRVPDFNMSTVSQAS